MTANVAPALSAALHAACDEKMEAEVRWFDQILAPLHEALFLEANPIPLKRALSLLGLMGDGLRLPLTPLSLAFDRKLRRVLETVMALEEKEAARLASLRRAAAHAA